MHQHSDLKKIAIVGPESTGKSMLAQQLAQLYKTAWVKEYARTYLEKLNRNYTYDDLRIIAKGQMQWEDEQAGKANGLLFCDTNLIVIKVWSDFKYGKTDKEIIAEIKKRKYQTHLLCNIDLPWQNDPLREHPHKREQLFKIYKTELKKFGIGYIEVKGTGDERLKSAADALSLML